MIEIINLYFSDMAHHFTMKHSSNLFDRYIQHMRSQSVNTIPSEMQEKDIRHSLPTPRACNSILKLKLQCSLDDRTRGWGCCFSRSDFTIGHSSDPFSRDAKISRRTYDCLINSEFMCE